MSKELLHSAEEQIFDFDPPDIKLERNSRRAFFSRMSDGFVTSFAILGTTALVYWAADEESYFQFLRSHHVEVPQSAVVLCLVAGLINALRGNYADRLSKS